MNTYLIKLRYILPVFVIIAFSSVVALLLVRWLFFIQFPILDIKEDTWEIWIPMIFPWIPITIWLRPRFRILKFKKETNDRQFFFQVISGITFSGMLIVSQSFLTTATAKFEKINTIREINEKHNARFYDVARFTVATYYGSSYADIRTSGKYNEYLNINLFFAAPILSDPAEKITATPKCWYGVEFKRQISSRLSAEEKESYYKTFYSQCVAEMNTYNFHSLDHFERLPTSDDKGCFLKAVESRIKQSSDKSFIILIPVSERYEAGNGKAFFWIFGTFGIGLVVLLLLLIWPEYSETAHKRQLAGKKPKQDDFSDMINYLIPKDGHFVTSIILDLNILIFLAMVFAGVHIISPNGIELLQWGANRRFEVFNGQWWRLFTNMFLHFGIMHLLLNIYGLVLAAVFIEPILGRKKYFVLYILSGLIASLCSIWWHQNTISAGASGAIFGLYGAILGLLLTNAFDKGTKKGILMFIGIYVAINLLWGLLGGVDNAAHIGGLVSGAIIGIVLYKLDEQKGTV